MVMTVRAMYRDPRSVPNSGVAVLSSAREKTVAQALMEAVVAQAAAQAAATAAAAAATRTSGITISPTNDINWRRGPERHTSRTPQSHRQISAPLDPSVTLPAGWTSAFELHPEAPLLGGGAFAKILRVCERASGTQFAVKVMSRPNFAIRGIEAQIDAEIEAMSRCATGHWCRHVARLFDTMEANDHVYLRMELCQTDLLRYANSNPGNHLQESDTRDFLRQLLVGLHDLHDLGILHRDIKPENLLCTSDGILKIADFGWCADIKAQPSSLAGTFQYMAPEILGSLGVQTEAVDVWSAGVTMLQLAMGRPLLTTYLGPGCTGLSMTDPHKATKIKTSKLLEEIYQKCPMPEEARPAVVSWHSWDCLGGLLMPEVLRRKTIPEALAHPWLMEAIGVIPSAPQDVAEEEEEEVAQQESVPSATLEAEVAPQEASAQSKAADEVAPGGQREVEASTAPAAEEVVDPPPAAEPLEISLDEITGPQANTAVEAEGSSASVTTPRREAVPTPPCASTTKADEAPQDAAPSPASVMCPVDCAAPAAAHHVTRLASTPQRTPQATPKAALHATPVRQLTAAWNPVPDSWGCRRSETAPTTLPVQGYHEGRATLASSRPWPGDPPSPCMTSRTPIASRQVQRARTSISRDLRPPPLMERPADGHHPLLENFEGRPWHHQLHLQQHLEDHKVAATALDDAGRRRTFSAALQQMENQAQARGLSATIGGSMLRGRTQSPILERQQQLRSATAELPPPPPESSERLQTFPPTTVQQMESRANARGLSATIGGSMLRGRTQDPGNSSTFAELRRRLQELPSSGAQTVRRSSMSSLDDLAAPGGATAATADPLLRTVGPSMMLVRGARPLASVNAPVLPPPPRQATSTNGQGGQPPPVSGPGPTAVSTPTSGIATSTSGSQRLQSLSAIGNQYPQRLAGSAHLSQGGMDRLSPRRPPPPVPQVPPVPAQLSVGRSPMLPMRSPPATPGLDSFRDIILARCATTGASISMAAATTATKPAS